MMSMVGVEHTNFIDPKLTWKTVSKGSRSASRRPRKLDSRSFTMGVDRSDNSSRTEDISPSESEKLGAAVLGQRFGDRVEHVPIKKRKFLFRSPSPPPVSPSLHHGDSDRLVNSGSASGQWSSPISVSGQRVEPVADSTAIKFCDRLDEGVVNGNIAEMKKRKLGYCEGFSGIEILLAAACNDNMADDGDTADDDMERHDVVVREGTDASSSAVPSKETVAVIGDSAHQDDLNGSVPTFPTSKDGRTEENSLSSTVDRSHWDLNTVMDAWGEPCANLVDSQTNVTDTVSKDAMGRENQEKVEGCKFAKDSEDDTESTIQFMVQKGVSSDAHGGKHVSSDSTSMSLDTGILSGDESKFRSDSEQIIVQKKYVTASIEPAAPESSAFAAFDAQTSTKVVSTDVCLDFASCVGSNCMTTVTSEEILTAPSRDSIKQKEDIVPGMHLGRTVKSETNPLEKHDIDFTHVPVPEKAALECIVKKELEDSGFTSFSHVEKISPSLSIDNCLSSGHEVLGKENPGNDSGKVMNISLSSPNSEDFSASVASVGEMKPTLTDDAAGQDEKALAAGRTELDYPASSGQKEPLDKPSSYSTDPSHCSTKVLDSEEIPDDRDRMVGVENTSELQEGYESQYEDGELRETLVQCASDIDAEDGEAEQVDYESDDRDMYDIDDADHMVPFESSVRETSCQPCLSESLATNTLDGETSKRQAVNPSKTSLRREPIRKDGFEKLEMDMEAHKQLTGGSAADVSEKTEHSSAGGPFKNPSQLESSNAKWTAWDQQPDGCAVSSDVTKEVNNTNMRRDHSNGGVDGSDVKDISTRVVGLREPKRGMASGSEGPSSFNLLRRNRNANLQQRRSNERNDDMCAEDERGPCGSDRPLGRMRSSLHMHGRGRGGQFDDRRLGLWNSKHHQFRSYDGPYDSRKPRPKSIVINSDSKVEDDDLPMYSHSKVYRPFVRRRPTRRDDDYHLHKGMPPRDLSPDRRSGRYPQRLSPKDGYFRSLPNDSDESFGRVPHNLARRERSFSPVFPRGDARFSHPHQRYRSRSRSRSPFLQQQLPRDRNAGLRPLSRSPDFRPEARMERGRFPFRKPSFESDYDVDFMSPPRRRFSPKRNPRWIDDRNRSVDDFRNRRSPARIFQQNHRFSSPGSPERLKPDYFRPGIRGGRFPNMACGGRGNKDADDDDYRRKPSNRYQMFHPVRRYGTDGGVRRFHYDDVDSFVAHDTDNKDDCVSGIDKRHRDMPRGGRERPFNNMWP